MHLVHRFMHTAVWMSIIEYNVNKQNGGRTCSCFCPDLHKDIRSKFNQDAQFFCQSEWIQCNFRLWKVSNLIHIFIYMYIISILDWVTHWPRELNALQLQKTQANRKGTSKSRKHFHHFDRRWYKCSQHKQIKKHDANAHNITKYILFAARFFSGLCCEHLQHVRCQIEEVVSLICMCFLKMQRVEPP